VTAEPPKDRREAIARAVKASQEPADGKTLREKMIANGTIRPAGETKRAPDGKFVPGSVPPKAAARPLPAVAAPVAGTAAGAASAAPVAKPIAMPKALRAELAPVWDKVDPAMQAAFAKYVEDASKGIELHRTKAGAADAILKEVAPFEAMIRAEGGTPERAVREILQTSYMLRAGTPAQKAILVAKTMNTYGIAPEMVAQALSGQIQGQPQGDPRYAQLEQQVRTLSDHLNSQQERQYTTIADTFGRDKPHWNLMKPHVAGILSRGEVEGADSMTEIEILDAAYKRALEQYPVISQAEAEATRQAALKAERDKANAQAVASRAAAVQVTGAPGAAAAPAFDPKDRRAVLAHAMRTAAR
jgi:hypothetical protein